MPAIYFLLFLLILSLGPGLLFEYWQQYGGLFLLLWAFGLFHLYMVYHKDLFPEKDANKKKEPSPDESFPDEELSEDPDTDLTS